VPRRRERDGMGYDEEVYVDYCRTDDRYYDAFADAMRKAVQMGFI
jgi:hypothetical protein